MTQVREGQIILALCWAAHLRRDFIEDRGGNTLGVGVVNAN